MTSILSRVQTRILAASDTATRIKKIDEMIKALKVEKEALLKVNQSDKLALLNSKFSQFLVGKKTTATSLQSAVLKGKRLLGGKKVKWKLKA